MKTIETLLLTLLIGGTSACHRNDALPSHSDYQAASSANLEEDRLHAQLELARSHVERVEASLREETVDLASAWAAPARESWSTSWVELTTGGRGQMDLGDWTAERGEPGI